jgi:hypothetical protein
MPAGLPARLFSISRAISASTRSRSVNGATSRCSIGGTRA